MNGRWPSNFVLVHSPPDEFGKGGCERVGTKRVKTEKPHAKRGQGFHNCLGRPNRKQDDKWVVSGYADPDGLETIDDFRCVENCPARRLGEQSGKRKSGARTKDYEHRGMIQAGHAGKNIQTSRCEASEGTAARFFMQADWSYERIEEEQLWGGGMEES